MQPEVSPRSIDSTMTKWHHSPTPRRPSRWWTAVTLRSSVANRRPFLPSFWLCSSEFRLLSLDSVSLSLSLSVGSVLCSLLRLSLFLLLPSLATALSLTLASSDASLLSKRRGAREGPRHRRAAYLTKSFHRDKSNLVDNRNIFLTETEKKAVWKTEFWPKPNILTKWILPSPPVSAAYFCKNQGSYQVYFRQNSLFRPKIMFLPNAKTDKSRNTETKTYFGRNILPKPNRNDIWLQIIPPSAGMSEQRAKDMAREEIQCVPLMRSITLGAMKGLFISIKSGLHHVRKI